MNSQIEGFIILDHCFWYSAYADTTPFSNENNGRSRVIDHRDSVFDRRKALLNGHHDC